MIKQFVISVIFILLYSLPISADEIEFFDQSFGDFSDELILAKEEGKSAILIFFEIEDCPFCYRMKTTILNQPDVVAFYKKHFKIFPIDIESKVELTNFKGAVTSQKNFAFKENRVRATPTFLFFDLQGKRVVRYTGPTSTKEEFLMLGEYTINQEYKQHSFTRYKRKIRKAANK